MDRCRYDDYGLESDFSDISKQKFEEYIGETVANFPADIMAPGTDEIPSDQPVYFKKWLEFRAKVIHDFIVKAREKVKLSITISSLEFMLVPGIQHTIHQA